MNSARSWSYHYDGLGPLGGVVVHTAPGTGLSLHVTDVVFSVWTDALVSIFFQENLATVLGPYRLGESHLGIIALHFGTPKEIAENTALTVTTSAALPQSIDVLGFIA